MSATPLMFRLWDVTAAARHVATAPPGFFRDAYASALANRIIAAEQAGATAEQIAAAVAEAQL